MRRSAQMGAIMKKPFSKCLITGFLFVSITGTLSHFLYQWTGENILVGLFAPVNEAVWEHIKLLFFPMLLFSAYAVRRFRGILPHIGYALLKGSLLGCLLIPTLYYTYTGAFGIRSTVIDIAIFFLSVLTAFLYARRLVLLGRAGAYKFPTTACTAILAAGFFVFTLFPPALPLFISPPPA